jgi:hypothetical protein
LKEPTKKKKGRQNSTELLITREEKQTRKGDEQINTPVTADPMRCL